MMSEEPMTTQAPATRADKWLILVVLVSFVILFFWVLLSGGRAVFLIQMPFHFLVGWFLHAGKALPPFLAKWPAILLPAGCLILAGVLIHRFICRCLAAKKSPLAWRPANTVSSIALLLLGCGAAIALSGVVHQTVWLMSERWIRSNHSSGLFSAMSGARQLTLALAGFYDDKGRYPVSFEELELEMELPAQMSWVKVGSGRLREPFILLHPGGKREVVDNDPLIISPLIREGGKIVVGYGDLSVRSIPAEQLEQILRNAQAKVQPASSR